MDDFIFFDVKGDSTLQNLNTVIENDKLKNSKVISEQDYIVINEPKNKKKNKKKKNSKKNRTYVNPTYDRPIIVDDDVYIDVESDVDENSDNNIISNNAFDILNKTTFNDYMDDDIINDYIENCKDDDSEENDNEEKKDLFDEKQNNEGEEEEIEFLNSTFAKNIIKSDVGVETEPVEMEMDLIKLLENRLSSDSSDSSSSEEESDSAVEDKNDSNKANNNTLTLSTVNSNTNSQNKNNKKKKKKGKKNNKRKNNSGKSKKNNVLIEIESNSIPISKIEKAISELSKENSLNNNTEMTEDTKENNKDIEIIDEVTITNPENTNLKYNNKNKETEVIEIADDSNSNTNEDIDIISLSEDDNNENVISLDDDDDDDVVLISENKGAESISSDIDDNNEDKEVILIEEDDDVSGEDHDEEEDDDEYNEDDIDDYIELKDNIFRSKSCQKKILLNDDDDDVYLYNDDIFEGGESTWDLDDKALEEKLKNSKFKALVNSDKDKLLRLQKKKLQKKELAQKREYLLQKKENLKKENKRIQKVLKSKKGNRLQTSPEVFKYLKRINTTIKEFVTNGFESIPIGNLPSELRKSVGMIAVEYGVKIKTRGSGKRKITNLIRTSRSRIPDNWNSIVETVFSKTEAQRHSNMDVRKRNLDMAKRRGKYHNNNNNKGKSSNTKPALGSKVGENATPISDNNKGFKLLQSMGWTPGESLGNNNSNGLIDPIEVVVRDQSGLGASYFDQGYSQSNNYSSRGLGVVDDDMDEYERDIYYNSRSSAFSSNKNRNKGKRNNKRFSNDNFDLSRKSSRSSLNSKRSSQIGETGGLENSPYNFVNFQKSKSLFTSE